MTRSALGESSADTRNEEKCALWRSLRGGGGGYCAANAGPPHSVAPKVPVGWGFGLVKCLPLHYYYYYHYYHYYYSQRQTRLT